MIEAALFGAGRIGRIHAGNLARLSGARLKVVADVNQAAADELASRHGAKVATVDAALADRTIGAVVIASSTDTHADLLLRAAAAGKAIFCEKPVDLDLARAVSAAEAVKRAGVTCLIGFQRRYDPTFAAVKARLAAGEIGDPEMLVVTSRDPGAPPVEYLGTSGGIFKDMLIHDFDIFRWILDDEAATIYATGSCLTDPAIEAAGDIDSTTVTIKVSRNGGDDDDHHGDESRHHDGDGCDHEQAHRALARLAEPDRLRRPVLLLSRARSASREGLHGRKGRVHLRPSGLPGPRTRGQPR